jgi:homoserine dehydrogenase
MFKIKLGIFGFGSVGKGLYKIINKKKNIEIKKICIKNFWKKRYISNNIFTTDKNKLLNDPNINVIVELINDSDIAFEIVSKALKKGKAVISANKKMIANNLKTLIKLQKKNNVPFLYEASCCASIPIIRNLEEYYNNNIINSIYGIFNGSTNYILTRMKKGISYKKALLEAQNKGFAETNPSLDINGIDTKYKLCIILFHSFGLIVNPKKIFNFGISKITSFDLHFAKKNNFEIKLLAFSKKEKKKIIALCIPTFLKKKNFISNVNYEYNGIVIENIFSEKQIMIGKGAGDIPTGSAVFSDIFSLKYGYNYKFRNKKYKIKLKKDTLHKIYVRYNNKYKPNFSDFEEIEKFFYGKKDNYLIGKIYYYILQKVDWIKYPNINIILFF